MTGIVERTPDPALQILLPGANFADAFSLAVPERLDAKEASRRILGSTPPWAACLMSARDCLVAPFGLKTAAHLNLTADRIGFFPIVEAGDSRVVLGFPDKHLDFRAIVATAPGRDETLITLTTLVQTHNLLGRIYLMCIKPFHRAIAR